MHFPEGKWISIKISLKFIAKGLINNILELVQMMVCCQPAAKPLSERMTVSLPMHICVTRPQWVKDLHTINAFSLKKNAFWFIYGLPAPTLSQANMLLFFTPIVYIYSICRWIPEELFVDWKIPVLWLKFPVYLTINRYYYLWWLNWVHLTKR